MEVKCQYIEGCPVYAYFCRAAEMIYRAVYCERSFKECARYRRRTAGEPVPINLLPQGTKLWEDDEEAPKEFKMPGS
jgi:hypothetical protein